MNEILLRHLDYLQYLAIANITALNTVRAIMLGLL